MDISKDFVSQIRKFSEKGDNLAIAEKVACDPSYISRVISTGSGSRKAVRAIIAYFGKEIPKRKKENEKLNSISSLVTETL